MYKITFDLRSAISFSHRPTFDSILAWCYLKDKYGEVDQKLNISVNNLENFDVMPLVKHQRGYFMASWLMFDNAIGHEMPQLKYEGTSSWKKRWAGEHDFLVAVKNGKTKRIRINAGEFKSYDVPIVVFDLKTVWFYFDSNNITEVERLVKTHLYGIGKKTAYGYGEITGFTIDKIDFDPFVNSVIRPIPMEPTDLTNGKKIKSKLMAWKPPYWLPENQTFCIAPQ